MNFPDALDAAERVTTSQSPALFLATLLLFLVMSLLYISMGRRVRDCQEQHMRCDRRLNKMYQEMARHLGTAGIQMPGTLDSLEDGVSRREA